MNLRHKLAHGVSIMALFVLSSRGAGNNKTKQNGVIILPSEEDYTLGSLSSESSITQIVKTQEKITSGASLQDISYQIGQDEERLLDKIDQDIQASSKGLETFKKLNLH